MRAWSRHRGPFLQTFCPYKSAILDLSILFKTNYPVRFFVKKTSPCQFKKKKGFVFPKKVLGEFISLYKSAILFAICHSLLTRDRSPHSNPMGKSRPQMSHDYNFITSAQDDGSNWRQNAGNIQKVHFSFLDREMVSIRDFMIKFVDKRTLCADCRNSDLVRQCLRYDREQLNNS